MDWRKIVWRRFGSTERGREKDTERERERLAWPPNSIWMMSDFLEILRAAARDRLFGYCSKLEVRIPELILFYVFWDKKQYAGYCSFLLVRSVMLEEFLDRDEKIRLKLRAAEAFRLYSGRVQASSGLVRSSL